MKIEYFDLRSHPAYLYTKYRRDGYFHLITCSMVKAKRIFYKSGGHLYVPVDLKHIWLRENMKKLRYDLYKRYMFYDNGDSRDGVVFSSVEDAMAFKLRWV